MFGFEKFSEYLREQLKTLGPWDKGGGEAWDPKKVMSTEERKREVFETKSFLAKDFNREITKELNYRMLKKGAEGKEFGSPETAKLRDFLLNQSAQEGYAGLERGEPSILARQSWIQEGKIRLLLTPDEAGRVLTAAETGRVPEQKRSEKAVWLHNERENITGWQKAYDLGSRNVFDGEKKAPGCFVFVSKKEVAFLPDSVKPAMIGEKLDLTPDGMAKVHISRETAREAFWDDRLSLSATGKLLLSNPGLIDCVSHDVADGDWKQVLRKIVDGGRKVASSVYLDPDNVLKAVDRQKNPRIFGSVFFMAARESIEHSAAREFVVNRAREKTRMKVVENLGRGSRVSAGAER